MITIKKICVCGWVHVCLKLRGVVLRGWCLAGAVFLLRRFWFVGGVDLVRAVGSRLHARIGGVEFERTFLDLLVDLARRLQKRLLHVLARFRRRLAKMEAVLAGEFTRLFRGHVALESSINTAHVSRITNPPVQFELLPGLPNLLCFQLGK